MKVRIRVTYNDIKNGIRCDTKNCPIARAISRRVKTKVEVYESILLSNHGIKKWAIQTPDAGYKFIENFDSRRFVRPISFTINIPKKYLKIR